MDQPRYSKERLPEDVQSSLASARPENHEASYHGRRVWKTSSLTLRELDSELQSSPVAPQAACQEHRMLLPLNSRA
jgi:hypothetical protein